MSLISSHWHRFERRQHPDDEPMFAAAPSHTFNLEYPPPAFIGSLDAPIVVLMSNGGYKQGETEAEFPDARTIDAFAAYLRGERRELPPHLSRYYFRGKLGRMVQSGHAVRVNAVPYRSMRLSDEPNNRDLAKTLPSLAIHRRWLFDEVLPAARSGDRVVFAHRNGWWKIPPAEASENVIFSDVGRAEPNRSSPDGEKLDRALLWLASRR